MCAMIILKLLVDKSYFLREKHMTDELQMCKKTYLWINYGSSNSCIIAVIKAFGNQKDGKEKTDETYQIIRSYL